jgi:hypothetical protein
MLSATFLLLLLSTDGEIQEFESLPSTWKDLLLHDLFVVFKL